MPWYFSAIAALSPVGPLTREDSPWRISISGQLTSTGALATACGDLADEPEKKFDIFSLKEGDDADGAAAGVGVPKPPPEHPGASSRSDSKAATGNRSHQRI